MVFQWIAVFFGWISVLIFICLVTYKFIQIKRMPLNLRWEVYPVPHETGEKRTYGGSYMEDLDWAKKPRHISKVREFAEMGSEIFFLKRVREHNPYGLWPFSITMHWGLYLLVLWLGLLTISNLMPMMTWLIPLVGGISFSFGFFGSLALIIKRAVNPNLRMYSVPIDYFNLVFLTFIFGQGLVSWVLDPGFVAHQAYMNRLITFEPISISPIVTGMFFTLQAFIIYMPMSKLIHYIMKHFTFTETLWDDAFNLKGSRKDRQIISQLTYKINWSAPHIGEEQNWLEGVQVSSSDKGERDG